MGNWNHLALKLLMFLVGALMVIGSALSFIGDHVFIARLTGVSTAMAGVAFGAGIMIAGFNPEAHVSWVRAVILYCVLDVIYEIFTQITLNTFDIVSFVIAIIVAVLLLVLYPNKAALWMSGSEKPART